MSNKYEKPCAISAFSIWLWFRSAQEWWSNGRPMQHTNPLKNQNCWYFVRPTQKTNSPKMKPKACTATKWAPWSINKAKNVDISLDQSKKTILQKVCTLSILGPRALAWGGSRQNCCFRCSPAHGGTLSSTWPIWAASEVFYRSFFRAQQVTIFVLKAQRESKYHAAGPVFAV